MQMLYAQNVKQLYKTRALRYNRDPAQLVPHRQVDKHDGVGGISEKFKFWKLISLTR